MGSVSKKNLAQWLGCPAKLFSGLCVQCIFFNGLCVKVSRIDGGWIQIRWLFVPKAPQERMVSLPQCDLFPNGLLKKIVPKRPNRRIKSFQLKVNFSLSCTLVAVVRSWDCINFVNYSIT
jgi:hypothetical protein